MPAIVLFDLNGVLYRYRTDARIDRLHAITGVPGPAIRAAIWDSGFEDSGDAGALDADAYLAGFGTRIGCPLSEADWLAALCHSLSPIAENLALLPALRPGVGVAVLTNNNLLVKRHFATLYPEIAQYGAHAFVSAEFAARKPDAAVYQSCAARLGVPEHAILFVDDSKANADGAAAAGLNAHHYTGHGSLKAALRQRHLLVSGL